jgi:hypothetical protein
MVYLCVLLATPRGCLSLSRILSIYTRTNTQARPLNTSHATDKHIQTCILMHTIRTVGSQLNYLFPILNSREKYRLLAREGCTCASAVASGKHIIMHPSAWSQKSATDWSPMLRQEHSCLASCVKQLPRVFDLPACRVVFSPAPVAHSRHRVGVKWSEAVVPLISHSFILLILGARKNDKLSGWSTAPLFLLVPVQDCPQWPTVNGYDARVF